MNDDQFDFEEGYQIEDQIYNNPLDVFFEDVIIPEYDEMTNQACEHECCQYGNWSNADLIWHHACDDNGCDACYDFEYEDVPMCKTRPIVHPSIASKAFNNYLLERNVIKSPALFEAIRVHGLISYQRQLMNHYVLEELISVVMHPSRIKKQMDQYDDIEDFFDAIGC
jgi:hypothetical protein